ncbi:UNVERIFIED_CONTAM: hypothetical protein Sradi_3490100 [Sesamum radiatum]|uniref:Uncharacterized protein n=1 Tax=Sesamum radiatum TaxID=300843 RepID=A0AAW2QE71_SESRA
MWINGAGRALATDVAGESHTHSPAGDLVKSDHGKVDTRSVPGSGSEPAGMDGPSMPDPVVHPRTLAALKTNPIAASWKVNNLRGRGKERELTLGEVEQRRRRRKEGPLDFLAENIGSETAPALVAVKASISDEFYACILAPRFSFPGGIISKEKEGDSK